MTDEVTEDLRRYRLVASAIAGRTLQVAQVGPGERAWTDGTTVFVDGQASREVLLESLSVQASLLATGALDPVILKKLGRGSRLAARYLAVEGQRSLVENAKSLPAFVLEIVDRDMAGRVGNCLESLSLADSKERLSDPPDSFGTILPRKILATSATSQHGTGTGSHAPRRSRESELEDLQDESGDDSDEPDGFSSPVGGGGGIGKLFQRMLGATRRVGGGGQPGADSATHRMRGGVRGGGAVVTSVVDREPQDASSAERAGITYPEWDVHSRRYRVDWCTVQELPAPVGNGTPTGPISTAALRQPLAKLGVGLGRFRRQQQGDDLDIDAVVDARAELRSGSAPDESVYIDSVRRKRDLAVMVLLDISGSAAEAGSDGRTVHEQQRVAAGALATALYELGDRVALYAFRSQGRSAVQLFPVKRFDDRMDTLTTARLDGLVPGAYSRLGAAIRHGSSVLTAEGGMPRRLLVVVSDGLAYDHGYERVTGSADARRALSEARRDGIGCVCLTVGAATSDDELTKVFGSAAHASVRDPDRLGTVIGPLFVAALRHADARRKVR